MFDRFTIRTWISVTLLFAFVLLWVLFEVSIPKQQMLSTVNRLESAVESENWSAAEASMSQLESQWKGSKLVIQMANGSEEVLVADNLIGQAKALVEHQEDDVIEHIGALKSALQSTTVAFPGP